MVAANTTKITAPQQLQGDFNEDNSADTAGEESEALALTVTDATHPTDWTYSSNPEDNTNDIHTPGEGTPPSEMDLQPGILYSGPSGISVQVVVKNLDVLEGAIIAPSASDRVNAVVFLNSTPMISSDEGSQVELDTETAVEFNIKGTIPNIQENDVIRIGVQGVGENSVDWEIVEGGEWVIY